MKSSCDSEERSAGRSETQWRQGGNLHPFPGWQRVERPCGIETMGDASAPLSMTSFFEKDVPLRFGSQATNGYRLS